VHRSDGRCVPWTVKYQEGVGRILVASRDIAPWELIMKDTPLVTVHNMTDKCIDCEEHLADSNWNQCECGFKRCNTSCSKQSDHDEQCKLYREITKLNIENKLLSTCLQILKLLQLEKSDPNKWEWLTKFMSHQDERNKSEEFAEISKKMLSLFHKIGLQHLDKRRLDHLLGILDTNSISVDCSKQVLLPYLSLASHSCIPNCEHWVTGKEATVRSKRKILAGEEITIRYSYLTLHRNLLRRVIRDAWFFSCKCERCEDKSELGTRASSFKCYNCREGFLEESYKENIDKYYECEVCEKTMDEQKVIEKATHLRSMEECESLDQIPTLILEMERRGAHRLYHSVVELKQRYVEGILNKPLNENICKIVVAFSQDLCKYMDTLNPGVSMMRGRMLFCMAKVNDWILRNYQTETKPEQLGKKKQELVKMMISAKKMISGYVT